MNVLAQNQIHIYIVKFSDDTLIQSLIIKNSNSSIHQAMVEMFVEWWNLHRID